MRPKSIKRFEAANLASIAVWLASVVYGWDQQIAYITDNPAVGSSPQLIEFSTRVLLIIAVVSLVVSLLLTYLAARRASEVAKWIITVLFAVSSVGLIVTLMGYAGLGVVLAALTVVSYALSAYAVWLMFRPDARMWFASAGQPPIEQVF